MLAPRRVREGQADRASRTELVSPRSLTKWNKEDLEVLKELIESGKVTPVIDKMFPLSETPQAIGYVEDGHAQGKVVVSV